MKTTSFSDPIIPELVVFRTLKEVFKTIREDYALNQTTEEKSLLYLILKENQLQRYEFFEQAKNVFIENVEFNEPKYVDVNIGWDIERIQKKFPTVHVMMQSESPVDDSVGIGSGINEPNYNETEKTYQNIYQRTYQQSCQLLITTDNSNETILIYHVLKSILISFIPVMTSKGFRNISFSGDDVNLTRDVTDLIMIRRLNMKFTFDLNTPSLYQRFFASGFRFTLTPTIEE